MSLPDFSNIHFQAILDKSYSRVSIDNKPISLNLFCSTIDRICKNSLSDNFFAVLIMRKEDENFKKLSSLYQVLGRKFDNYKLTESGHVQMNISLKSFDNKCLTRLIKGGSIVESWKPTEKLMDRMNHLKIQLSTVSNDNLYLKISEIHTPSNLTMSQINKYNVGEYQRFRKVEDLNEFLE